MNVTGNWAPMVPLDHQTSQILPATPQQEGLLGSGWTPKHGTPRPALDPELEELLAHARAVSHQHHGARLDLYVPGHTLVNNEKGKYPSISLTGRACALNCDHCQTKVLWGMLPATSPEQLVALCQKLDAAGDEGVLLSGGCDRQGRLPWGRFLTAIAEVHRTTDLYLSVHTGVLDAQMAVGLKEAGVSEALLDVIGDELTLRSVYHLDIPVESFDTTMGHIKAAGLRLAPHIVAGLYYGKIRGEYAALEMIAKHDPDTLIIVGLMPLKESPMEGVAPPLPEEMARLLATARIRLPKVPISLACARPRGTHRWITDSLAVEAGVNRIAIPSDQAIAKAKELGLDVHLHHGCCSH